MNHSIFLKNRFSSNFKQLLDAPYLVAFFFIAFFYTLIEVVFSYFNWKEQSQFLILHVFILFLVCFLSLFASGILLRFCSGMLLNKTQPSLQRMCALILTLAYFFMSTHFIYQMEPVTSHLDVKIPLFNFTFLSFIGLSVSYQFITARALPWGEKFRYVFIFFTIGLLLTADWWFLTEKRKKITNNLSGTEIVYVFNSQNADLQPFLESAEFHYVQEKFNLKREKDTRTLQDLINSYLTQATPLYASNIGAPSQLLANSNAPGTTCKNTENSIFTRYALKYTLPIANLVPNALLLKVVPDLFCLYLQNDLARINLLDIYNGILKQQSPQKTVLSIIELDNYPQQVKHVFQNMEIIRESFDTKDVKLKIYFTQTAGAESIVFLN